MVSLKLTDKAITDQTTDSCIFFIEEKAALPASLKAFAKNCGMVIEDYLAAKKFTGAFKQTIVIPFLCDKKIYHCIIVGLGKKGAASESVELFRRALAHAYKTAASIKSKTCSIQLPAASTIKTNAQNLGQQTATTLLMTDYHFDEFLEEKDNHLDAITLCVSSKDKGAIAAGIKDGEIIATAVNKARHWINTPPTNLNPPDLAKHAKAIAKKHNLACTVFTEKQIIAKGMGGLASVGRGSEHDSQLVLLEYKTKKKNAPTVAFVGKGITFDSGGLSLKPPVHMETMKEDMSGAAAVIATMEALALLKPDINVIGVTPLAENLPGNRASKPGDIVRFYNGKTAEIKNTDAEGRLVLADALAYTVKHYKPDAIIDVATLTGACAYALGPFFTGLMSQNETLLKRIENAGAQSGDRVWRLPLHDDYKIAIKSDVADICNIGSNKYMAGAVTAAHFLKHFTGDVPFAHLDIAGTAFNVPDMPYFRTGATGVGVRLLTDIALNWN